MEDLEIRDDDGDKVTLSEDSVGATIETSSDSGLVNIGSTGARAMVDWLQERFELTRELTAIGMDSGLELAVETETGKSRTVRWYGPDVPGELIKLAGIAMRLTEDQRRPIDLTRATRFELTSEAHACKYLEMVVDVLEVLRGTGVKTTSGTMVADVRALAERAAQGQLNGHWLAEISQLVRDPNPVNGVRALVEKSDQRVLRQLMGALGVERVLDLPDRVLGLVREVDALANELAGWAGVNIPSDGINLLGLIAKIKDRHRKALANQMAGAQATLNQAVARHRQAMQVQATQHDEFRRTVPMQIENALSTERNARAAVQAELDKATEERRGLARKLRVAEDDRRRLAVDLDSLREVHAMTRAERDEFARKGRAAREALELAEGTQGELTAKLEKARAGLGYARAQYYTPEEEIGAANWDAGISTSIVNGIDKALRDSDPDA